jgi:ATP-dependent RNA helicase DeaD
VQIESRLPGVTISDARDDDSPIRTQGLDFLELFVNVGKREGARPSDFQRLLTEKGLSSDEVGQIRVRERMSYLHVRKNAFDRAVAALSGQVLGGRTIVAELARGRAP